MKITISLALLFCVSGLITHASMNNDAANTEQIRQYMQDNAPQKSATPLLTKHVTKDQKIRARQNTQQRKQERLNKNNGQSTDN